MFSTCRAEIDANRWFVRKMTTAVFIVDVDLHNVLGRFFYVDIIL